MGLKSPLGFGPLTKPPSSSIFMGFIIMNRHRYDPAPPGRVTSNSYIPNIRPQIDLNWFMSIFNT